MHKFQENSSNNQTNIFAPQKVQHKRISPYGSKYQTAYNSSRNSKTNLKSQDIVQVQVQTDYQDVRQVFSFQNIPQKMMNLQKHLSSEEQKLKQKRQAQSYYCSPKNSNNQTTKDNYRQELIKQIQETKERKKKQKEQLAIKDMEDQRKFYSQIMNQKQRQKKTRQMKRNQLQPTKKEQKIKSNESYFMMRTIYKNKQKQKNYLDQQLSQSPNFHFQKQYFNDKNYTIKPQNIQNLNHLNYTTELRNNNSRKGSHFSLKKRQEAAQNLNYSLRHYKNKQSLQSSLIQNVQQTYDHNFSYIKPYNTKESERLKRLQQNQNKILSKLGLMKNQIIDKFNSTHHRLGQEVSRVKDALRSKSFFINRKQQLDDSHYYMQPYESYEIPHIIQEEKPHKKSPKKQQQKSKPVQQKKPKLSAKLRRLDQLYQKLKKKNQQISVQKQANSKLSQVKIQEQNKKQVKQVKQVSQVLKTLKKKEYQELKQKNKSQNKKVPQKQNKQLRDIGVGPDSEHEFNIQSEQDDQQQNDKNMKQIQRPIILNLKEKIKKQTNQNQQAMQIKLKQQESKREKHRQTPTFKHEQVNSEPNIAIVSKRIYGKKTKQQAQQKPAQIKIEEMFVQGRSLTKPQEQVQQVQQINEQSLLTNRQDNQLTFGGKRQDQSDKNKHLINADDQQQQIIEQNYEDHLQNVKNIKQNEQDRKKKNSSKQNNKQNQNQQELLYDTQILNNLQSYENEFTEAVTQKLQNSTNLDLIKKQHEVEQKVPTQEQSINIIQRKEKQQISQLDLSIIENNQHQNSQEDNIQIQQKISTPLKQEQLIKQELQTQKQIVSGEQSIQYGQDQFMSDLQQQKQQQSQYEEQEYEQEQPVQDQLVEELQPKQTKIKQKQKQSKNQQSQSQNQQLKHNQEGNQHTQAQIVDGPKHSDLI